MKHCTSCTTNSRRPLCLFLALAAAALLAPDPALAYVGPGAGLAAIGTVLALISALLLAVVGFLWYPLKRLLRRSPRAVPDEHGDAE